MSCPAFVSELRWEASYFLAPTGFLADDVLLAAVLLAVVVLMATGFLADVVFLAVTVLVADAVGFLLLWLLLADPVPASWTR